MFDYVARQKVGGTHLTYGFLNQLPVPTLEMLGALCAVRRRATDRLACSRDPRAHFHRARPEPFARDLGYDGPPFRWESIAAFLLRAEIDAAIFHLYGITREDVDHILDTFPIVRRKDERAHGEYRTKRVILEIYDEMAAAARAGHDLSDPARPADRGRVPRAFVTHMRRH